MGKKIKILFIEDDQIEVMKMQRSLEKLDLGHEVITASNGEDALKVLDEMIPYPDVILMDLNMPKINGIEFLSLLKSNQKIQHIPAVVLTTSSNSSDLKECYRLGIAGYFVKPLKYQDYVDQIGCIINYWVLNEQINQS